MKDQTPITARIKRLPTPPRVVTVPDEIDQYEVELDDEVTLDLMCLVTDPTDAE